MHINRTRIYYKVREERIFEINPTNSLTQKDGVTIFTNAYEFRRGNFLNRIIKFLLNFYLKYKNISVHLLFILFPYQEKIICLSKHEKN